MLKIGFISDANPNDRFAWSGILFNLYKHLSSSNQEVVWIPIKNNVFYKLYSYMLCVYAKIFGRRFSVVHTKIGSCLRCSSIDKDAIEQCDVLFSAGCSQLAYLSTSKKIIYMSDATFKSIYGYYPTFSNFFSFNVMQGNEIEKKALEKAYHVIYSSDWAKQSAIFDYGIPAEKISVIEFGANIDEEDIIINERKLNGLHLLFLGVEWERKGGDIAVETTRILNTMGVSATLHIVGISNLSDKLKQLPYIDHVGFLNKNREEQYRKLVKMYSLCDLLLLPTKAECSAIAFAESSAYGLPIFSFDTGGVANYVFNGENGYLLPLGAKAIDFAEKINECYHNGELSLMRMKARKVYEEKLNWNVWKKKVEELLLSINC